MATRNARTRRVKQAPPIHSSVPVSAMPHLVLDIAPCTPAVQPNAPPTLVLRLQEVASGALTLEPTLVSILV